LVAEKREHDGKQAAVAVDEDARGRGALSAALWRCCGSANRIGDGGVCVGGGLWASAQRKAVAGGAVMVRPDRNSTMGRLMEVRGLCGGKAASAVEGSDCGESKRGA